MNKLTEKQQQVMGELAKGQTLEEVGKIMGISRYSVHDHVEALKKKGVLYTDSNIPTRHGKRYKVNPHVHCIGEGETRNCTYVTP